MKVCHLTSVHDRYDGRIFSKECISLRKAGYDISLIVADGKEDEIKDEIKIYGIGIGSNRIFRMFQTTDKVYKKAIELNADIYHLHDPELIPVGVKLKKRGKKVVFDSHEDIPQQILSKKYINVFFRKVISKLYAKYEFKALQKFDGIVTVSPIIVNRLKLCNTNTVQVTNYPTLDDFSDFKSDWKDNAICFAGLVDKNFLHHNVIKAINKIDGVNYYLAGPINEYYLDELKKMGGWEKVCYFGLIPYDEVLELYRKSKIGITIHDYTPNTGGKEGSLGSVKNFEFMAMGLPIICTNFRVWKEIIETENCGICVNPHNPDEIVQAIRYLLENPDKAEKMGCNGRKAVENKYNWQIQENILLNFYKNIV